MIDVFQMRWASIDHVKPVTNGGTNDQENLVTACWRCNLAFRANVVGTRKPPPEQTNASAEHSGWDGLLSLYPLLGDSEDDWSRLISKELASRACDH
jgi:hypothetical protein